MMTQLCQVKKPCIHSSAANENFMRQRQQLVYFVCGYALPTAGVILTIVFTVMYGSQFGRRAVVVPDGVGGTTRADGPREQYAAPSRSVFL